MPPLTARSTSSVPPGQRVGDGGVVEPELVGDRVSRPPQQRVDRHPGQREAPERGDRRLLRLGAGELGDVLGEAVDADDAAVVAAPRDAAAADPPPRAVGALEHEGELAGLAAPQQVGGGLQQRAAVLAGHGDNQRAQVGRLARREAGEPEQLVRPRPAVRPRTSQRQLPTWAIRCAVSSSSRLRRSRSRARVLSVTSSAMYREQPAAADRGGGRR